MTYPAFESNTDFAETRNGPVVCASCGCRLQQGDGRAAWFHFAPMAGRDARGCLVECADAAHDAYGRTAGA